VRQWGGSGNDGDDDEEREGEGEGEREREIRISWKILLKLKEEVKEAGEQGGRGMLDLDDEQCER
jgi:hypothetical protein